MLSPEQRREFEEQGFVRLPGLVPRADAAAMSAPLWEALRSAHGIEPERPATWTVARPSGFQALTHTGAFAALGSAPLRAVLDDLLGAGDWEEPRHWGQPLVTFPSGEPRWDVPRSSWHLDIAAPITDDALSGVRVFCFLEAVRPGGGATAVVAASHRVIWDLVARGAAQPARSAKIRAALMRNEPWFRALQAPGDPAERAQRLMSEVRLSQGVPVRVAELTGEAGDVTLMDVRLLHAASANSRERPRLVLAQALYKRSALRAALERGHAAEAMA